MVSEDIGFVETKFEIENVKKFTFYPTHVSFTKDTSAKCPVNVFQSRIIGVLEKKKKKT